MDHRMDAVTERDRGMLRRIILAPLTGDRRMKRTLSITTIVAAVSIAAGIGWHGALSAQGRGAATAPHPDPLWPKPLPNHWILGSITGIAVDKRDHVWVVQRG